VGRVFADDSPETPNCRCGIIALTDCSPLVIAAEKGFFKKHGLNVTIAKGANWAAIRDSLSKGDNQFTHLLLGMPIASRMGLLGSPKKPMVIPWLPNRNGQAITLPRPHDRRFINENDDFKRLRNRVVESLLAVGTKSKTTIMCNLVLPDIEPEDISTPRLSFGRRGRSVFDWPPSGMLALGPGRFTAAVP
jgi:hypothetical protein